MVVQCMPELIARIRVVTDPTLVVGLEDTFTRVARVREIPSVEPAITERFGGVVFGCHGWGGSRSESCLFGWLLGRSRAKC